MRSPRSAPTVVGSPARPRYVIPLGVTGFLLIGVAWHLVSVSGFVSPILLPAPSEVMNAAEEMLAGGALLSDALHSLRRVSIGFLWGATAGVAFGILLSISWVISSLLRPVLETLRPIPGIAWIPLAILWFGIGNGSSYFIVAIATLFPVFVNTYVGITSVNERYLELARGFGASRRMIITEVVLPAALPSILTGLRVGLGVSWMTVIAAELVAAESGLGYLIQLNRSLLRTPRVIVGMLLIGLIGAAMGAVVERVQRYLTPWQTRS